VSWDAKTNLETDLGDEVAPRSWGLPEATYDNDPVTLPQIQSVPEIYPPPGNAPPGGRGARVSIVVVGGLDPGGGAGLLRDVATATARGAQVTAVGTAWTQQGAAVHRVEPREPAAVGAALAHALGSVGPAAVKIGMAVGAATAAELMKALRGFAGAVVVDPVLSTSRGGPLWDGSPAELLPLLRRATLVTPNATEAGALRGQPVETADDAEAAGRHLVEVQGLTAVLVKGGHLAGVAGPVVDVLTTAQGSVRLPHLRLPDPSPRGTGCALATAIAVELGRGRPLPEAIAIATGWLVEAIASAVRIEIGGNHEYHLPNGG
jgi:hydroxymethylpyrimidine/phosphomethylpyrimidine kinase